MQQQEYFVNDVKWREGIKKRLQDVQTLEDFRNFALLYNLRDVGDLIVKKIDRLTEPKIKENGRPDGRWRWENSKACWGKRVKNREHVLDRLLISALQTLILRFGAAKPLVPFKLVPTGFRSSRNKLLRDPLTSQKIAIDICSLLIEVTENKKLPD